MRKFEPREHVIDAELANGNLDAWRQVLGFSPAQLYMPDEAETGGRKMTRTDLPATGKSFETAYKEVIERDSQNGEAFKAMSSDIWAAGASLEEADFITRMLARKGLYLFQTSPWKRCPSTHCERGGLCCSPRDCTIKEPSPLAAQGE